MNLNLPFLVITLPPEDCVHQIDFSNNLVITKCGIHVSYKRLCLCHGARPKLIVPDHCDKTQYIIGIRDTESINAFQTKLGKSKRICIVGNGGIATEMVYELKGVDIVWAIKDDSISATFVDAGAGEFFVRDFEAKEEENNGNTPIKRLKYSVSRANIDSTTFFSTTESTGGGALGPDWHNEIQTKGLSDDGLKRVHVEYKCDIKQILTPREMEEQSISSSVLDNFEKIVKYDQEIEDRSWNVFVELSNGKVFGCDFIVSATGVIPNGDKIMLLSEGEEGLFQLSEDNAIEVNDQMETNIPNIHAAGDVCCANWTHSKHWFQMRLWTQARQMGMYAAQCMEVSVRTERREKKDLDFCFEMFTHATKFFGYKVILLGLFNGQKDIDYEVLLRVTKGKEYVKCVMSKDGRMQGAILIGETDLEETFENLILNQMDLSVYGVDLLDPNIDIEDYFD